MLPLITLEECEKLVAARSFKYAEFDFEYFNPVQSALYDVYDDNANFVIAMPTGGGKTATSEMVMSHEVRANKKKVIYLSPLKSLSQEKLNDWQSEHYHFRDLKISICTGDYRMTPERKKELDAADIIIMTSEMLNSASRNYKAAKNEFLHDVGTVVVDECHEIGDKNRGDHLENGIMKFTEINSKSRFLLLSATMPNVEELGMWLSHLNGKTSYVIKSDKRALPLNIHYEKYNDVAFAYDENENRKIFLTTQLLRKYPNDKFICFVHTKRTGELLLKRLDALGIVAEYHNANVEKNKRVQIENRFREDPRLKVVVATSGLSKGLNMPARRVIILGIHRGLHMVDRNEIVQAAGRAGRPKYDKEGDAYVLVPIRDYEKHVRWLETPTPIRSCMIDPKVLAFHIVSEIHHRTIKCIDDVYSWYKNTLAYYQRNELEDEDVERIMKHLIYSGCVKNKDGQFDVTPIGMTASMFYFSPFDVSDLNRNFKILFDQRYADHDLWLSMALGNVDSNRGSVVNTAEKAEMEEYALSVSGKIEKALSGGRPFTPGAVKAGYCYYLMLQGQKSSTLGNAMKGLRDDFGRVTEVLTALDAMANKWGEEKFIRGLGLRVSYGVSQDLAGLCNLNNIGKVKAEKLYKAGLRSLTDVANGEGAVINALKCSEQTAKKICENAKMLLKEPPSPSS